ncbi:(5-formylfuran-3-yl)methyl phosphate synthase [Faunimonas sp. B44]|uniref:(5-formylfuran-3-yl)methyl phosphate synthase n=1 Tax=Faunimonas sp. B44 TaxID=3461493 RepID=UPI0040446C56
MTLMLASVADPDEAELVVSLGADIVDAKDPKAGALGALPPEAIAAIVATVAGRRPVSAVIGDLPMEPELVRGAVEQVAGAGVDHVKIGFFPGGDANAVIEALAEPAGRVRLIAVLFADRVPDFAILPRLARGGFAGVMLDTAGKGEGRLLDHIEVPAISGFMRRARNLKLQIGLAGSLEAPDVPRLLPLKPDFLGFRGALCSRLDRTGRIDAAAVKQIRSLIPSASRDGADPHPDLHVLAARGYAPDVAAEAQGGSDRIFVRDFVLPVQIGAYSHERVAPQRVRFDVTVETFRISPEAQDLSRILSYDLITDGIRAIVAEGHIDLAETLAERIAARLLLDPRTRSVTVRVEKLDLGSGGVGVEIVRRRALEPRSVHPLTGSRPAPAGSKSPG